MNFWIARSVGNDLRQKYSISKLDTRDTVFTSYLCDDNLAVLHQTSSSCRPVDNIQASDFSYVVQANGATRSNRDSHICNIRARFPHVTVTLIVPQEFSENERSYCNDSTQVVASSSVVSRLVNLPSHSINDNSPLPLIRTSPYRQIRRVSWRPFRTVYADCHDLSMPVSALSTWSFPSTNHTIRYLTQEIEVHIASWRSPIIYRCISSDTVFFSWLDLRVSLRLHFF